MEHKKTYIYGLHQLGESVTCIRYIGRTVDPAARLLGHKYDRGVTSKAAWVRSLADDGETIGMIILDTAETSEGANAKENAWILLAKNLGWQLTNSTSPGHHRDLYSDDMKMAESALRRAQKVEEDLFVASGEREWYKQRYQLQVSSETRSLRQNIETDGILLVGSGVALIFAVFIRIMIDSGAEYFHDNLVYSLLVIWLVLAIASMKGIITQVCKIMKGL